VETIHLTDFLMLDWMHTQRNSVLDLFFRSITWTGSLYLLIPAIGLLLTLLYSHGKLREMQLLAGSMIAAVIVVHVVKLFFRRPRPDIHPGIIPIPGDWSFPSAHSAQITTFCLCIILIAMRNFPTPWAWLTILAAIALALGVGVSRVYLQVHYPTDVVAGFFLGIIVVTAADLLIKS
jgi:membrane-associated phospholipid phosphatase